jgi:glutamate synthase (NADPH/NADH) small chain
MDYLYVRNRAVAQADTAAGDAVPTGEITAKGKHVVVIGGGDTGADCVGNSLREGALSVTQLELLPEPPRQRSDAKTPWPLWPQKFRLSYAQEEGRATHKADAAFSVVTTRFEGNADGTVRALVVADAEAAPPFGPVEGTERELQADLVLLAMGFLHPEPELIDGLGLEKDPRGNIRAGAYETSVPGVFAAGDCRRGQSLIVWAINEGRQAARMAGRHLGRLAHEEERSLVLSGNVSPADEGPEGPPLHTSGGMPAGDRS